MKPIVTLGLPVFNAAPHLPDALRSVFAQSLTDWELVCVEDGSTDGSAEMLARLKEPRVRVFADGRHRGLGSRLNQIVALAKGQYIARMDADDLMHPERLARQVALLEERAEVDVVGCSLVSFDAAYRPVSARHLPTGHAEITAKPLRGIQLAHATVAGRAEWWKKHPYNEENDACEDFELWLSSYETSRFANLPEALYYYREEQAYSFAKYVRRKRALVTLLRKERKRLGSGAWTAMLAQWPRIAAYALAHAAGLERTLVRRRGRPVSTEEARQFAEAVQGIRTVSLPLD